MRGKAGVLGRPVTNSLLLHFDGSNGSTTFTDSSPYKHAITRDGNAEISTSQSKFGGAAGYFDGTGDGLQVPAHASLDLSQGDFTIEAWIYPTSVSGLPFVFGRLGDDLNYAFYLNLTDGLLEFIYLTEAGTAYLYGSEALAVNQWVHVAIVRDGDWLRLYANGTQESEIGLTWPLNPSSQNIFIGRPPTALLSQSDFSGYIDELRISKGIAVYTANFTPPTSAFN